MSLRRLRRAKKRRNALPKGRYAIKLSGVEIPDNAIIRGLAQEHSQISDHRTDSQGPSAAFNRGRTAGGGATLAAESGHAAPRTPDASGLVPQAPLRGGLTAIEVLKRPLTPQEVLDNFYANRSEKTILAYQQDMAALASFMGVDVPGAVSALLRCSQPEVNALAVRWLDSMAHLASATRYRRLVTLRSFGRAARVAGHVTWVVEIKGPKVQRYRDTRGVTEDGVHKMFAACGDGLLGLRNRVILFLLGVLGLRRSEVAALNTSDLNPEGKRLHVLGKGKIEKWLNLPVPVARAVNAWHVEREMMQLSKQIEHWTEDQNTPLVCSLANQNKGERLTGAGINFIVHEIAERAGVKAWAHALRHSTVTVGLDRGHSIQDVQALSRHSKLETVQIYDDNRQRRDAAVSDDLAELYDKGKS